MSRIALSSSGVRASSPPPRHLYYLPWPCGAVAQLGERNTGSVEVRSSILLSSTTQRTSVVRQAFFFVLRIVSKHLRAGGAWGGRAPAPRGYPASPQIHSFGLVARQSPATSPKQE